MDEFDMMVEDRMCEAADCREQDDFEAYNQNEADDYRDEGEAFEDAGQVEEMMQEEQFFPEIDTD